MEGGARPADRAVGRAEVVATSRPRSLEALYLAEWVRFVRLTALLVLAAPFVDDIAVRRHGLHPPAVDQAGVELEPSSLSRDDRLPPHALDDLDAALAAAARKASDRA